MSTRPVASHSRTIQEQKLYERRVQSMLVGVALGIIAAAISLYLILPEMPIAASVSMFAVGVLLLALIHVKRKNPATPLPQPANPEPIHEPIHEPIPDPRPLSEPEPRKIVIGSKVMTTRVLSLPKVFTVDSLELNHDGIFTIQQGEHNSIQMVADDNIVNIFNWELDGSKVILNSRCKDFDKDCYFDQVTFSKSPEFVITLRNLPSDILISSGKATLMTFSGEKANLNCRLSRSANVEVIGQLHLLRLDISQNAAFSGAKLECDEASVYLSGDATVSDLHVAQIPKCSFGGKKTKASCTYILPHKSPVIMVAPPQ